jgi:hypothetical protein
MNTPIHGAIAMGETKKAERLSRDELDELHRLIDQHRHN